MKTIYSAYYNFKLQSSTQKAHARLFFEAEEKNDVVKYIGAIGDKMKKNQGSTNPVIEFNIGPIEPVGSYTKAKLAPEKIISLIKPSEIQKIPAAKTVAQNPPPKKDTANSQPVKPVVKQVPPTPKKIGEPDWKLIDNLPHNREIDGYSDFTDEENKLVENLK